MCVIKPSVQLEELKSGPVSFKATRYALVAHAQINNMSCNVARNHASSLHMNIFICRRAIGSKIVELDLFHASGYKICDTRMVVG